MFKLGCTESLMARCIYKTEPIETSKAIEAICSAKVIEAIISAILKTHVCFQ
jgi:hypothetical protein